MRKLPWNKNPKIGFWIDNDPVRLYYGTPFHPDIIAKTGIIAPTKHWVTLNLDPYTAQKSVGDGVVIILDIPMNWMFSRMDQRLNDNNKVQKDRLLLKDLYDKWEKDDSLYYVDTELHIVNSVPARYIIGFTQQ